MSDAGSTFGGHELVERLGEKGSAEIWVARNDTGELFTMHIAPYVEATEEDAKSKVEENLQIARRIQHDNIVRVLSGGISAGKRFILSELVDGVVLTRALQVAKEQNGWPSPWLAGYLIHEVGRALAYLHQLKDEDTGARLGLVYRELTPMSILLERSGAIKLFELSATSVPQRLVETAGRKQTAAFSYISPELADRSTVDERSDIFALGTIFWELLAERPLFTRSTDLETIEAIKKAEVPALPASCPSELSSIVVRCLEQRPESRWQSATELVNALANTILGKEEAGPTAARALAERTRDASKKPKKAKTAIFSEEEQAPLQQSDRTVPSDPPTAALEAARAKDPFFDADRDAKWSNDRFEVLSQIGAGGMGEVYRVRDRELDEIVALKLIPRNTAKEMKSIERLKREVRIARRIASDHVCRTFDIVDLGDGARGLTMSLIEGTTLAELMNDGIQIDYRRFAQWGADVADGLAAAHELSVLHRDLKPENIMIRHEDDRAVILDFGIARSWAAEEEAETSPKLTQAGVIMGTPLYMSPEQLSNRPLDGKSDLYSLGLILAELMTGEIPQRGGNYAEILDARVIKAKLFHVQEINAAVPDDLAAIIDGLVVPAPVDRTGSAADVRDGLLRFLSGEAPPKKTEEEAKSEKPTPPRPDSRLPTALALTALALISVAIFFYTEKTKGSAEKVAPQVEDAGGREVVDATVPDTGVKKEKPDAGKPDSGKKKKKKWTPPPPEEM